MARKNQHVVRHAEGWAVKGEGNSRATRVFDTQWEAIEFGRIVAMNQRSELLIHNRKGIVRDRKDFRNYTPYTPYPSYGTYPNFLSRLTNPPSRPSPIPNPCEQKPEAESEAEGVSSQETGNQGSLTLIEQGWQCPG